MMLLVYVCAVCVVLSTIQRQSDAVIVERPLSTAVTIGHDVTFYCSTDNLTTNVDWCIDKRHQSSSSADCHCLSSGSQCISSRYILKNVTVRLSENEQFRRYSLTVVDVARHDVGKYTCRESYNPPSNVSNVTQCAQLYAFHTMQRESAFSNRIRPTICCNGELKDGPHRFQHGGGGVAPGSKCRNTMLIKKVTSMYIGVGMPQWNVTRVERATGQDTSSSDVKSNNNSNSNDDNVIQLSFTFDTSSRAAVTAVNVDCRRLSDGLSMIQENILGRQKQWIIVVNDTSTVTYNCTTVVLLSSGGCHEELAKFVDVQFITILEVVSEAWAITANIISGMLGVIVITFIAGLLLYSVWKHLKTNPRNKGKKQQQENGVELKPLSARDEKETCPEV